MRIFLLGALLLAFHHGLPQLPAINKSGDILFTPEMPLRISLELDIQAVIKDSQNKYHQAQLVDYSNPPGRVFPIKVKVRGNTRRNPEICKFPPLEINFRKKELKGSIFEGQNKLKLVTHCGRGITYEKYLLREFLVYKLYNQLTENSFKVRLVEIAYKDSATHEILEKSGFIIEDDDQMAERNNFRITERKLIHQEACDKSSLDLFTVFQYMIGNNDWSVNQKHNIKLMANDTMVFPIPVPYDFDFSGFVNAHYASPPPTLPLENVRERLFRGYCRDKGDYLKVFAKFNERREQLNEVIADFNYIDEKEKSLLLKYLDDFYDIINDSKKAKRILEQCQKF